MLHSYFNSFHITGKEEAITQLFQSLEALGKKDKVFKSLVGAPANATTETMKEYYGVKADVPKSSFEYNLHSPNEMYAEIETTNGIPQGFVQKLSSQYGLSVDVEYECPTHDVAGKMLFENGKEIFIQQYNFIEGKYRLDTEEDKSIFWEELQIRTEDVYNNNYDSAEEIIKEELPFLNKKERQRFIELYEHL